MSSQRIVLIIGGGIAAYKCLDLVRRLRERGIGVRAVLTKAAQEFVTPLSVAALTNDRVFTDLFDPDGAEIYLRPASYYLRDGPGHTFATLVDCARRRGEVALGYREAEPEGGGHGIVLNPDKESPMPQIDRVIVLANN